MLSLWISNDTVGIEIACRAVRHLHEAYFAVCQNLLTTMQADVNELCSHAGCKYSSSSSIIQVTTFAALLAKLAFMVSCMQDKVAAEDQADLAHTTASMDDAANSPEHASHLAQPSNSMALSDAAIAANIDAELDSLAAACPAAAAPSESSMQAPDTPQPPSSGGMGTSTSAELGSTMLSMSSQTLAALPTPTHPSAIPAATAQALNNELGRSLLQVPLDPEEAAAASPHSERLTSAYSGMLSCWQIDCCLTAGIVFGQQTGSNFKCWLRKIDVIPVGNPAS